MKFSKDIKILIVGLGLLGGSYAKALKAKKFYVTAITKNQCDIDYALKNGIIDTGSTLVNQDTVSKADLIVFALYPHIFTEWIEAYQHFIKPGAIITDVTGVKCCIVEKIQKMLRPDIEFIAAHPMAGREVCGIENSDPSIFSSANYIVVPTDKNSKGAITLCKELGNTLGFSRISELTVEKHDEMIAFLSQLTHCIAVTLMCCNNTPGLENYTGDSFRDLTRIARINDEMWSELFLDNREALLYQMESFKTSFDELYNKILTSDRDGMREMMRCSTERRKRFDKIKPTDV